MMVTGNRMNNGTVLSKVSFFNVNPGQECPAEIEVRPLTVKPNLLGTLDVLKTKLVSFDGKQISLSEITNRKGIVLCFIEPGKEPTNHVMNDIKLLGDNFEKWGGGMAFVLNDKKYTPASVKAEYKNMPAQSVYYYDKNKTLLTEVEKALGNRKIGNLPVILLLDDRGQIYFVSEGYSIGTGEQLYKNINLIDESGIKK